MQKSIKKIAIIGPESTGKSTLCEALAKEFNTIYVPEFAREYLGTIGTNYDQKDLDVIAIGQLTLENKLLPQANEILFCDTDLYVIKIWSEVKYNACSLAILNNIANTKYDYYLLTNIDMPWQIDVLREHPEPIMRNKLMKMYIDVVQNSGVPFSIISGNEVARIIEAKLVVNGILAQ